MQADAIREKKIREADGEAQAILAVQKAQAESIKLINEANPGKGVIALRSLASLEKVADGQSTKLIIPSEIQSVAGLAASVKEMIEK